MTTTIQYQPFHDNASDIFRPNGATTARHLWQPGKESPIPTWLRPAEQECSSWRWPRHKAQLAGLAEPYMQFQLHELPEELLAGQVAPWLDCKDLLALSSVSMSNCWSSMSLAKLSSRGGRLLFSSMLWWVGILITCLLVC